MQAEPIRGRWQAPSDELIMLAVDRAERHKRFARDRPGVTVGAVAEHLGMSRGSVAGRRLNPLLRRLEIQGPLARFQLPGHSMPLWVLSEAGERLVQAAVARGAGVLPESPQHRAWREARADCIARLPQFRTELIGASLRRCRTSRSSAPCRAWSGSGWPTSCAT
jgi:hypothetical protein